MELLPIMQAVSTPVLLVIGGMAYRGMKALHSLDKRLAIVEFELQEHRKTEETPCTKQ